MISYGLSLVQSNVATMGHFNFITIQPCKVMLKVFFKNEEVRMLLNDFVPKGNHATPFDYNNLPKGEYLARLIVETDTSIDKETITIQL